MTWQDLSALRSYEKCGDQIAGICPQGILSRHRKATGCICECKFAIWKTYKNVSLQANFMQRFMINAYIGYESHFHMGMADDFILYSHLHKIFECLLVKVKLILAAASGGIPWTPLLGFDQKCFDSRVSSAPTFSYILLYFGGLLLFSYI